MASRILGRSYASAVIISRRGFGARAEFVLKETRCFSNVAEIIEDPEPTEVKELSTPVVAVVKPGGLTPRQVRTFGKHVIMIFLTLRLLPSWIVTLSDKKMRKKQWLSLCETVGGGVMFRTT
jgi:hypothetical protein